MARQVRKVLNDPRRVVVESLEGLVDAYGGRIAQVGPVGALAKRSMPGNKVGLLIGGGSGHEPLFPAFIGDNLADGAACGNVFAAPTPDVILAATRAVHQGRGVLYVYGNYSGDNLNFGLAAELAAEEGIETRTVTVYDDVASASPEYATERRGIAGDLFVIKVAGAVAATCPELAEVERVTAKARDSTRSLGVSLAAGSIPETGEPTFELPEGQIEVGMGLHGERGVSRQAMSAADPLVDQMLDRIVADLPFVQGDRVCVLVNDLGSTTWMELLIVNRRVHAFLRQRGIRVHDTVIGSYCTCQEMAGFSITLMRLDDELTRYYDLPCRSLGFTKG